LPYPLYIVTSQDRLASNGPRRLCPINSRSWSSCRACRYERCLVVGMRPDMVNNGKRNNKSSNSTTNQNSRNKKSDSSSSSSNTPAGTNPDETPKKKSNKRLKNTFFSTSKDANQWKSYHKALFPYFLSDMVRLIDPVDYSHLQETSAKTFQANVGYIGKVRSIKIQ